MRGMFRRLDRLIADDPNPSLEAWRQKQPVRILQLGGREWVLNQPLSSFLVFFLGLQTCYAATLFHAFPGDNPAAFWWSISLWLWGIGALLAGVSYQLFAWEIKCRGRFQAAWTSWWEVVYMLCQQWSVNAMLAGVAYATTTGWLQQGLLLLSVMLSVVYGILWLFGAFRPERQLISFEFMSLYSAPVYLVLLAVNGWYYWQGGAVLDGVLTITWIGLFLSMGAYYIWYGLGWTGAIWKARIWNGGWWFSDNDVLHVTLIAWMFYIIYALPPLIV